ncbi:MAG TPA: acyl carrier protein [Bacteroidales bacterium]|nr:acyl carrier protein [Bacteroidales bacterium]
MNNGESALVTDKVKSYVMEETFADGGKINNETLVFKEGYFDSMGFVRLVSYLENEFKIRISDADLVESNFESINAISDFVVKKVK